MRYFSGFALHGESELFDFWLSKTEYSVAGFSYGAIKALEYTLDTTKRIDRLLLLSPAFFNNVSEAFKKTQLLYYKKDPMMYIENFAKNISDGTTVEINKYLTAPPPKEDLEELLYYKWDREKLEKIANRGTTIEVVLAQEDKIIDAYAAREFFEQQCTLYWIKKANHILRVRDD